jgi:Ca2+:H+ antiporter
VALAVLLLATYGLVCCFRSRLTANSFPLHNTVKLAKHRCLSAWRWVLWHALRCLSQVSEVFVESVQQAALAFGRTPAFVGFIVVALVGGAAEMGSSFSGARKNRLDLSVGIALGSASQIALFVAPVLVLLTYFLGPQPMDLQFWPGAVVMMLIATMAAALVTSSGRSPWFVGVLVLMVYLVFAMTLYLLPLRAHGPLAKTERPTRSHASDKRLGIPLTVRQSCRPQLGKSLSLFKLVAAIQSV